jgi:anti-sigma regulatory factor (Ser/Thr protein kinase)
MLDAQHIDECHRVCGLHSGIVDNHADMGNRAVGRGGNEESRAFKFGPDAPYAARRFVIAALTEWGIPDLIDDAASVVAELATNAVMHATSDFVVALSARNATVRISVRDPSVVPPVRRRSSSTATRGRGIAMIDVLSSDWGVERAGTGKEVWAELTCPSAGRKP